MYQRLSKSSLFGLSGDGAWTGDDHLLLVTSRFFNEFYLRLYWGDIQAILLYELERPQGFLLIFEWICALAPLMACAYLWYASHILQGWIALIPGVLATGWYVFWRRTRMNWACRIPTKTGGARFPVAVTYAHARGITETLKNRVTAAQGMLDLSEDIETQPGILINGQDRPKKPMMILHGIVFVLGLILPPLFLIQNPMIVAFTSLFSFTYCFGLIGVSFIHQDFEFPLTVRAAAVMSQAWAICSAIAWIVLISAFGLRDATALFDIKAQGALIAVQGLFSLFGIAGLYTQSLKRPEAGFRHLTTLAQ